MKKILFLNGETAASISAMFPTELLRSPGATGWLDILPKALDADEGFDQDMPIVYIFGKVTNDSLASKEPFQAYVMHPTKGLIAAGALSALAGYIWRGARYRVIPSHAYLYDGGDPSLESAFLPPPALAILTEAANPMRSKPSPMEESAFEGVTFRPINEQVFNLWYLPFQGPIDQPLEDDVPGPHTTDIMPIQPFEAIIDSVSGTLTLSLAKFIASRSNDTGRDPYPIRVAWLEALQLLSFWQMNSVVQPLAAEVDGTRKWLSISDAQSVDILTALVGPMNVPQSTVRNTAMDERELLVCEWQFIGTNSDGLPESETINLAFDASESTQCYAGYQVSRDLADPRI
jgi:hypothetical protein